MIKLVSVSVSQGAAMPYTDITAASGVSAPYIRVPQHRD